MNQRRSASSRRPKQGGRVRELRSSLATTSKLCQDCRDHCVEGRVKVVEKSTLHVAGDWVLVRLGSDSDRAAAGWPEYAELGRTAWVRGRRGAGDIVRRQHARQPRNLRLKLSPRGAGAARRLCRGIQEKVQRDAGRSSRRRVLLLWQRRFSGCGLAERAGSARL